MDTFNYALIGNEQLNLDTLSSLGYSYNPCLVNLSNVICVGASDEWDALANFSNSGRRTVHIAAPGRAIMSTMISEYQTLVTSNQTSVYAGLFTQPVCSPSMTKHR